MSRTVRKVVMGGDIDHASEQDQQLHSKLSSRKKQQNAFLSNGHEGVAILIPILLGLALGLWLDGLLGTKPILLLFFLLAGTVSSFYNVLKLLKKQ